MSEITKLYENAGLSNMWVERYNDGYYEHERYYNSYKEMINNMMKANDWTLTEVQEVAKRECKKEHPHFTAEKQLEIVKQILFSTWWMNLKRLQFAEKFEEGLAQMINELWQDLTEQERTEIKRILE